MQSIFLAEMMCHYPESEVEVESVRVKTLVA